MKLEQMAVILAQASSVFSNYTLTKEAIKTWHSLFANTDLEEFHAAMRTCVKEPGRSFFPAPGEVNKIILQAKRLNLPDADEAWSRLLSFASGGNSSAAYEYLRGNEVGLRALDRVTFHSLRYADIETELPWIRKEFISSYNEISQSIESKEAVYIGREEAKAILNGPLKQLFVKGAE